MREGDRVQLADDFHDSSASVGISSRVYQQLYAFIATQPQLINLYDSLPPEKHIPAQLLAAVRYLTFTNPDEDLSRLYATPDARDVSERLNEAFATFCDDYEYDIVRLMRNRVVQMNEPNRCNALLPALMKIQRETRRSLALVEVGASAGFNLLFDRYRYDYTGGAALGSPGAQVRLNCVLRNKPPQLDLNFPHGEFRAGIDLEPPGFGNEEDERWLRACIRVGDVGAEQRFDAALTLAKREWPDVREGDGAEELERVVNEVSDTDELVVINSFAMQAMSSSERNNYSDELRKIGNYRPLWWLGYEPPGIVPGVKVPEQVAPALLSLRRMSPTGEEATLLARGGELGEWMEWLDPATTAW